MALAEDGAVVATADGATASLACLRRPMVKLSVVSGVLVLLNIYGAHRTVRCRSRIGEAAVIR